ncbi:paraquat-inducible protein A [Oceanicoccus sp. KOV_DT_Chl]|uniref:paraquat-inducible protein A n=1 Tax=Oceanicoccus sp. KOV_DT_Chl TaxID=1904639 RepID=UPI000C7B353C|nr:paraquat-inducible protein A [Oceanicoccus sp. KOV_DT_Chl]
MHTEVLCHECDCFMSCESLSSGQKACCPRCGAVLLEYKPDMINRTQAFAIAGLLFYLPANLMPIMTFEMMGVTATNTMLQGVQQLFSGGFWWMGLLVMLCSIVVPLLDLCLLFLIAILLKTQRKHALTLQLLVWRHHLSEWAMLEVYMLGILVAYIKMSDMGGIDVGMGMYCFAGMLLAAIFASSSFDSRQAFEMLEAQS